MKKILQSLDNIGKLLFFVATIGVILALTGSASFLALFPPLAFLFMGTIVLSPVAVLYGVIKIFIELRKSNIKQVLLYGVLTLPNILYLLVISGLVPLGWVN